MIDAHVHTDEQARRDALRFGVTTEFDMFGDPEVLAEAKRQRQSLERTNQADLWSAGIGVTVPGGHPNLPGWEYPRLTSDATCSSTPRPMTPSWEPSGSAAASSWPRTDAGLPGTAAGASMSAELSHLVRAGRTPPQALAAATAVPARRFGLTDRSRVAPGLRADLVLVNGDPTTDITVMRDIAVIWKNGYQVERRP